MDRAALKARAREVIATSNPKVLTVGLVYLLIGIVLNALGARVMSVNISESELMNYMRYAAEGNYEYALEYLKTMEPPTAAYAINSLLKVISSARALSSSCSIPFATASRALRICSTALASGGR